MYRRIIRTWLLCGITILLSIYSGFAQHTLDSSSAEYAKVLRSWFIEDIEIHNFSYPTTRIRCSNRNLSHYKASAGKTDIGLGSAFHIEGSLTLDALPPGLKVVDGAQGKKYMLLLQGYLFSPEGELLWSQKGFPQGSSWVSYTGTTVNFHLINSFTGKLKGCTAAIVAVGDPIFIDGTSEMRVILGMELFSFDNEEVSTGFNPAVKIASNRKSTKKEETEPNLKLNIQEFQYIEKEYGGWKYSEVVTIPEATRKKIFFDLVLYQDKTGDDYGAYNVIGKRYSIPERAVKAIAFEGALKKWPMPEL